MKRIRIFVTFIAMLFTVSVFAQTEIRTAEELALINYDSNSLKGSYVLMNDLTLNNWTPVGGFSGTFDGNGYTITITCFNNSFNNTSIGLFGSIEKKGVVKNLRVAGNPIYTCEKPYLYIGGIAGDNSGIISTCVSTISLEAKTDFGGKQNALKLFDFTEGIYGGCIVGVNLGTVVNCYSTGSVTTFGNRYNFAGGIAGANGKSTMHPYTTDHIVDCYSTATVRNSGGRSGGVAGVNYGSGDMFRVVSLNDTIEGGTVTPAIKCGIYSNDIVMQGEIRLSKPFGRIKTKVVERSDTQEQSWWRYPEGLTKKQIKNLLGKIDFFGFPFGEDEEAPWKWNEAEKRPVLYWEK